MSNEQTATKTPKYNLSLDDSLLADIQLIAGALDISKAEAFRRAVAHFRKAVESGQVK